MDFTNDDAFFTQCRKNLFSAVIGDVMDTMGYLHQFLPPQVQPLRHDMVLMGRAMPVLEMDDSAAKAPSVTTQR